MERIVIGNQTAPVIATLDNGYMVSAVLGIGMYRAMLTANMLDISMAIVQDGDIDEAYFVSVTVDRAGNPLPYGPMKPIRYSNFVKVTKGKIGNMTNMLRDCSMEATYQGFTWMGFNIGGAEHMSRIGVMLDSYQEPMPYGPWRN